MKTIKFLSNGKNFSDKLGLFIGGVIRKINRYSNYIPWNIYIKNEDGLFLNNKFSLCFINSNCHEYEIKKYFEIPSDGVFIDIGANNGKYSIMLGNKYINSKIIAIEPEPNNINFLKKNIELNNLKNIEVIEKGIYSDNKNMNFYIVKNNQEHSLDKNWRNVNKSINIRTITIDNLMKELKLKKVDLIKIDIEGVELHAIKGALKTIEKYKPKIIIETIDHFQIKNSNEIKTINQSDKILKLIYKFGYKYKRIDKLNYLFEIIKK